LGTAERSVLLRLAAVQGQVGFDAVDQEKTLGLADLGSGDLAQRFELEPRPAERAGFCEGGERPGERLGRASNSSAGSLDRPKERKRKRTTASPPAGIATDRPARVWLAS